MQPVLRTDMLHRTQASTVKMFCGLKMFCGYKTILMFLHFVSLETSKAHVGRFFKQRVIQQCHANEPYV